MNGNSRDILGAVLAGGRSSRMGRDKAGLLMGQDTFLARALRAVRSVCPETVISLRPDAPCRAAAEKAGKTVWDDGLHGPMGGLAACLEEAGKSGFTAVLACACDMPLLSADVLDRVPGEGKTSFRHACHGPPSPGQEEAGAPLRRLGNGSAP